MPLPRPIPLRIARASLASLAPSLVLLALSAGRAPAAPLPVSWQVAPPPNAVQSPAAIVDVARDRMLVYGGNGVSKNASGDLWEFDLVTLEWRMLRVGAGGRAGHSAVYDAAHDRMIHYGGREPEFGYPRPDGLAWALATIAGTNLPTAGNPGPRTDHVALVDAARDRMLVLGGVTSSNPPSAADTVYRYDLSAGTWSKAYASGPAPVLAGGPIAALDAAGDRVIALAGGVYQLTLSDPPVWSALAPSGAPPPDLVGRVVGDPAHGRLLLVREDASVWALSLDPSPAWTQLFGPGPGPGTRQRFALVLDAERNRAVLFGGWSPSLSRRLNDTWAFDLDAHSWSLLSDPGQVPQRADHAASYVPSLDAMLVFGGAPGSDVLVYPLDARHPFSTLATTGTPPTPRSRHAMTYDPVRNRLLVFGGSPGNWTPFPPDVFALALDGTPTWSSITVPGGPRGRVFPSIFHDPVRDRLVVFGGIDSLGYSRTDVWALPLSGPPAWQLVMADGVLAPLAFGGFALYDPSRDEIVVLGIPSGSLVLAWKLNLSGTPAWTSWDAGLGAPANLYLFRACLDPYGDRVLLYGGMGSYFGQPGEGGSVLRSLSLASPAWTIHSLSGAPQWMAQHTMVHDPARFRTVLFGGIESPNGDSPTSTRFVWLLNQDTSTPALVSLVSADVVGGEARIVWQVADAASTSWRVERAGPGGGWEPAGVPELLGSDRLEHREAGIAPGARVGFRLIATENRAERALGEVWVEAPGAAGLSFSELAFESAGALRFGVTVPGAGPARLEVFDLGGRRIGTASFSAGADGRATGSLKLDSRSRPGVCFVRLGHGGAVLTRKVAVVF